MLLRLRVRHVVNALAVVVVASQVASALPGARAGVGLTPASATAIDHLRAIVARSPAPEYRRYGTQGMAQVSAYAEATLHQAGYTVVRHEVPGSRWWVDYLVGHEPLVERLSDGTRFPTESGFDLGATTDPNGITCVVKALADVTPGDCGLVPFAKASPEWKNVQADLGTALDQIVAKGGVAAVIQGDVERHARIALRAHRPIPVVVTVASAADLVGERIRLRAMGEPRPAVAHDVIGVRRPTDPAKGYALLLAHGDGWFQAAADNGGGAAAILRAAQLLHESPAAGMGVVVALVDGEEVGLLGSTALAKDLGTVVGVAVGDGGPALHLADIRFVLNLDASSARASDVQNPLRTIVPTDAPVFQWRAMVFSPHPTLPALFLATFAAHGVLGLPVTAEVATELNGGIHRTDAGAFDAAGIPVVWPVAGYPEYHTDADTLDAVDPVDLEAVATAAADLVRRFASANA